MDSNWFFVSTEPCESMEEVLEPNELVGFTESMEEIEVDNSNRLLLATCGSQEMLQRPLSTSFRSVEVMRGGGSESDVPFESTVSL